jgi:PHD/YefM family antitoxin component YafN of YafNO toxin-antitoxin module
VYSKPQLGEKMNTIQTESVTGFRNNYNKTLKQVASGPVMLIRQSQVAAVLISPDEWNQLQRYKQLAILDEQSKLVARGEYFTQEQIDQGLKERGLI